MRLVLEAHQGRLEHAAALDVDLLVAVDQNVVDGRILEQRLDRSESHHLVEDLGDEVFQLLRVEGQPFRHGVLRDHPVNLAADFVLRHLLERGQVDLLDQPAMQPDLGIEQLFAQQRAASGRFGSRLGLDRRQDGCHDRRGLWRRQQLRRGDPAGGEASEHLALPRQVLDGSRPARWQKHLSAPIALPGSAAARRLPPGSRLWPRSGGTGVF